MRKETVFFGLVAIALSAFFAGRMVSSEKAERPAAPDAATVRPATTAVSPVAAPAGAEPSAKAASEGSGGGRPVVPPSGEGLPRLAREDATGSPAMGPTEARVTMIIVSDFECPYCRRVEPTVKRLMREFRTDLRIVWKNNPLPFHQRAKPAAIAALAAHRQGKFWEYHDRLFESGEAMDDATLLHHAAELGLDVERFRKDIADPAIATQILREQEAAKAVGARGTPTFFVNGKALVGAKAYSEFKAYIDEARVDADVAIRGGTPVGAVHEVLAARNHPQGKEFVDYLIRGEVAKTVAKLEDEIPRPDKPRAPSQPVPQEVWKVSVGPNDPWKGAENALVTIVEFSDFECPFCSKVGPTIERILEAFPDEVRIVWKNSPLPFHKRAGLAAEAALAAHAQGKFWEFHDKLFANQRALDRSDLERYAQELGLDMTAFRQALDAGTYKARIAEDQALAERVNARGTPNLFVNGRQIVGARPFEDFEPVIREEIEKARKIVAQGVSPLNAYNQIILKGKTFAPLSEEATSISTSGSPMKGRKDAPIVIAEFSDFQCPYCSRVGAPLKEIQARYPDRVTVVFKNFPLNSIHQDAQLAAEAALAANSQGKFWEFHDLLFQNQKALKRGDLERYAAEVGLDVAKFSKALDDGTYRDAVREDVTEGSRVGVRGTPTVYINGRLFQPPGGITVPALEKIIQDEFGAR